MKTQTTYNKWMNALMIMISAMTIMACGKDKGSSAAPVQPGYPGIGFGSCPSCGNFAQGGPVLFQGTAAPPNSQLFSMVQAQVVADAQGYQQSAASGLRPLVNGNYPAAVGGVLRLTQPYPCGQMMYPAGDYNIQMLAMGQNSNGIYYAPQVSLVSTTNGMTIQPAAVAVVWVDANLDNVADRGSLFKVGFCGQWLDMNTL